MKRLSNAVFPKPVALNIEYPKERKRKRRREGRAEGERKRGRERERGTERDRRKRKRKRKSHFLASLQSNRICGGRRELMAGNPRE